jgi:hypothetical protein
VAAIASFYAAANGNAERDADGNLYVDAHCNIDNYPNADADGNPYLDTDGHFDADSPIVGMGRGAPSAVAAYS